MGYTDIAITGPVAVSMRVPDGTAIRVEAGLVNEPTFGWGIDLTGQPYFDAAGASPGEQAQMGVEQDGTLYLIAAA